MAGVESEVQPNPLACNVRYYGLPSESCGKLVRMGSKDGPGKEAMPTATKEKPQTPLTDSDGKPSQIVDMTAGVSFDWDKLPAPTAQPKAKKDDPSRGRKEEDVPERIRHMVEQALGADEIFVVEIPDEKVRGAFVQWVRVYCFVRKAGRLTSRIVIEDETKVRYSVTTFKERKAKTAG